MRLESMLDAFGLRRKKRNNAPTPAPPPDPASQFTHPGNKGIFAFLKEHSRIAGADRRSAWDIDAYVLRAHPDLVEMLYQFAPADVRKGAAFGTPILANSQGLVFAWAGGSHDVFLRLPEQRHDAARRDGGRVDNTYPRDWIEFRVGGRREASQDWRDMLQRWLTISHQDSLGASTLDA
jgi:hypothetical protein